MPWSGEVGAATDRGDGFEPGSVSPGKGLMVPGGRLSSREGKGVVAGTEEVGEAGGVTRRGDADRGGVARADGRAGRDLTGWGVGRGRAGAVEEGVIEEGAIGEGATGYGACGGTRRGGGIGRTPSPGAMRMVGASSQGAAAGGPWGLSNSGGGSRISLRLGGCGSLAGLIGGRAPAAGAPGMAIGAVLQSSLA